MASKDRKRVKKKRECNTVVRYLYISTGSPQGTVLSPIPFTLYTNDCTGTDTTPIIKYSDETAIEDLSNSDSVYFAEVERSVTGAGILPLR